MYFLNLYSLFNLTNYLYYFRFLWTSRIKGTLRKWSPLFEDTDILMYWCDISSVESAKKSYADLLVLTDQVPSKSCVFLMFLGMKKRKYFLIFTNWWTGCDELLNISKKQDLSSSFSGYQKSNNVVDFLEEKFTKAAKPKTAYGKPTFKVFTERVERSIDVKVSILAKLQSIVQSEESDRVIDIAKGNII